MPVGKVIDISQFKPTKIYHASYIVLFNPTLQYVENLYNASTETFIFIFLTGDVDSQIDWSGLPESSYLVQPIYLGDINSNCAGEFAHNFIKKTFKIN